MVRSFQESSEPQSISPIVTKEPLKLQMAIVANSGCKWTSVDGCAAFPQSKGSPRDVYVEFPPYIKELGNLWKLKEHLHGPDNVSRKFWQRIKDAFPNKLKSQTIERDKSSCYLNVDGEFQGAVVTHVEDSSLAGMPEFFKKVTLAVEGELTGSKVEENTLQDMGLKVKVVSDGNKIFLEEFSRKPEDRTGPTAKLDLDPFRKMTGQVAWLANSTWPDLCYLAPQKPKKAWMSNRGAMEEQSSG